MKKISSINKICALALVLALCVCALACVPANSPSPTATPTASPSTEPTPTQSAEPTATPNPLWELFDFAPAEGGYAVTAYCGTGSTVTVPEDYLGEPVVAIAEGVFAGKTDMTELVLPTCMTEIGSEFADCSALVKLTIPTTLIGKISLLPDTFETLAINNGTEIPASAFMGCSSLDSVTLPDTLLKIGNSAFANCFNLTSISIPHSVTEIGGFAFANCFKLVEIKNDSPHFEFAPLTAGTGELGESALNVYSSVEGQSTLLFVDGYTLVTDGEGTTWLSSYTGHEDELTLPTIGKEYKINYRAFFNAGAFTSVTIPEGVTEIGYEAFYGCGDILHFDFPSTLSYIDYSAIFNCAYVIDATYAGTVNEWNDIEKHSGWNLHAYQFPIYCTDGTAYSR